MPTKKVIVIDDAEILLNSYEYYINSFEGYKLEGLFTNVNDALNVYDDIYPDIILSDISMPGIDGIEGISRFKALDPNVKIVLISVHDDAEHVMKFIKNKAEGYLTKPVTKDSLFKALEDVKGGGAPLSGDISNIVVELFRNELNDDVFDTDVFSKREIEILKLFTRGFTYNQIAESLFITHSTVNFHIQKIYDKLNVRSKSEALERLKDMMSNE